MIVADKISYSYGEKNAIDNISLTANAGEVLTILGPNGGGKSTLLKCLNNMLIPKNGAVYINQKPLSKMSIKEIAKEFAFVPQKLETIFPFTVKETIEMGLYAQENIDEKKTQVKNALKEAGITDLQYRYINELSGGEMQLVFVARALAQNASVLLLDEATSNLDISHTATILKAVKNRVKEKRITVISVVHDINLALKFSDKILFLNRDRQTTPLPPYKAITPKIVGEFYKIDLNDIEYDVASSTVNVRF